MEIKRKSFGERLKEALKDQGCTQRQLAEMLGVHENTIAGYIKNQMDPSLSKVRMICHHLNVPITVLLFGETPARYAARLYAREKLLSEGQVIWGKEELEKLIDDIFQLNDSNKEAVRQIVDLLLEGEGK